MPAIPSPSPAPMTRRGRTSCASSTSRPAMKAGAHCWKQSAARQRPVSCPSPSAAGCVRWRTWSPCCGPAQTRWRSIPPRCQTRISFPPAPQRPAGNAWWWQSTPARPAAIGRSSPRVAVRRRALTRLTSPASRPRKARAKSCSPQWTATAPRPDMTSPFSRPSPPPSASR